MRVFVKVRNGTVLLAALAGVFGGTAMSGCGSAGRTADRATRQASGAAAAASPRWPSRTVLAEPEQLRIVSQVLDPRTMTDFAMTATRHESYRLRRTTLADGKVRLGPVFPVSSIGLGSGSVGSSSPGRSAARHRD